MVNGTSSARRSPSGDGGGGISWRYLVAVLPLAWWTIHLGLRMSSWCVLDWVNLPFHEAGHLFLRPFGTTVHFLGGTFGQLLVPALLIWYFLFRMPNRFAAALCTWWLGESLFNVSVYMADARSLNLDLVGGGDHDWNHLFYTFGLLDEGSVRFISGTTHLLAVLVMLLGLAWCCYFVLPPGLQHRLREPLVATAPWLDLLLV